MRASKKKYSNGGKTPQGDPKKDSLAFEQYLKQKAEEQYKNYLDGYQVRNDAILNKRVDEVSNLMVRGKKVSAVEYLMQDEKFRNRIKKEYESEKPAVGKKAMTGASKLNIAAALKKKGMKGGRPLKAGSN
jgi:glutamine amidotransferase PdxT